MNLSIDFLDLLLVVSIAGKRLLQRKQMVRSRGFEAVLPADLAHVIEEQNRRDGRTRKTLREYGRKRDFSVTAEHAVTDPRRGAQGSRRRFVVQKHAASHLHYDFRLEMHDVLKSSAVPKGIPYEPGTGRLASATEDHPLEYLDFEGVISKAEYGGGGQVPIVP